MIKNIPFSLIEIEVSQERQSELAKKGVRLYAKYCGLDGCGICAESFAEYHIARGELVIARNYLEYLTTQLEQLTAPEEERQREITEALIARIQEHIGEELVIS